MAGIDIVLPLELQLQAKTVQEEQVVVDEYSNFPVLDIPIIDLHLLASPSSDGNAQELEKLRSALSSFGCFQAINHGMASGFLEEMREATRQFFALPTEETKRYGSDLDSFRKNEQVYFWHKSIYEGYSHDVVVDDGHHTPDSDQYSNDRAFLVVNLAPEDKRKLNFWPENPQSFRGILDEYTAKSKVVAELLLKAMARSLNLEENSFWRQYGAERAGMFAKFNFYPRSETRKPEDPVVGLKAHTDGSAVSIVLPDKQVPGLQILRGDQWFRIPVIPQPRLLIILGDQMEIMSNGIFKSPMHRVVANSERERITLSVFCIPQREEEIEPVKELITETRPRLYKKLKDYVSFYLQYYGRNPIHTALI